MPFYPPGQRTPKVSSAQRELDKIQIYQKPDRFLVLYDKVASYKGHVELV